MLLPKLIGFLPLCAAPLAWAHSPYLLPNQFDLTQRDHVSVQASFAEEFFVPDIVMQATDYHCVKPDGSRVMLQPVYTKDVAILDVDTPLDGTYRLSTGIRRGRTAKARLEGADWRFLDERAASLPADGIFDMTSVTRADAYVSRRSPTDTVLAAEGKGLEFQMLTHPNKLFAGSEARLRVLYNGQPLAGQRISLRQSGDSDDAAPPHAIEITSDPDGRVALPLPDAGLYHAMTRYRFVLPAGNAAAESHTYAVTLEVTE